MTFTMPAIVKISPCVNVSPIFVGLLCITFPIADNRATDRKRGRTNARCLGGGLVRSRSIASLALFLGHAEYAYAKITFQFKPKGRLRILWQQRLDVLKRLPNNLFNFAACKHGAILFRFGCFGKGQERFVNALGYGEQ
jgi:hypothetical protein